MMFPGLGEHFGRLGGDGAPAALVGRTRKVADIEN